MFRQRTVFVVGAGASCELNFPSGAKLLQDIAGLLDIRFDYRAQTHGDRQIVNAFRKHAEIDSQNIRNLNDYVRAARRIRDAAALGISIDNVIHQLGDDDLVSICGKIAITRAILGAESNSALKIDRERRDEINLSNFRDTWLAKFVQMLVQDVTSDNREKIFDLVTIISFNYDRSIKRFLPHGLASQFGIDIRDAEILARKLTVLFPYGSLGRIPPDSADGRGVGYGDSDHASLLDIYKSIRTFTEQIKDDENLTGIATAINSADQIVFLGFGYHRQNMELLSKGLSANAKRVYGTSLGLSDAEQEEVAHMLRPFIRDSYQGHGDPNLQRLTAADFLDQHFRTLTA
jgi:hypothetical protein